MAMFSTQEKKYYFSAYIMMCGQKYIFNVIIVQATEIWYGVTMVKANFFWINIITYHVLFNWFHPIMHAWFTVRIIISVLCVLLSFSGVFLYLEQVQQVQISYVNLPYIWSTGNIWKCHHFQSAFAIVLIAIAFQFQKSFAMLHV